ncbi:MAG: hypothetical protein KDB71_14055 [Mycobacterium sp.]|nr:hypothetical protein [Mycobacterium sp.]
MTPTAKNGSKSGGRPSRGRWTGYGVGAAALGALTVAAAVLVAVLWTGHRAAAAERNYQARLMQTATEWTGQLINMNADNVEATLGQLREKTVGELNTEFNSAIAPYRDVVKTLRTRSNGSVLSVSVEALHNKLPLLPGQRPPTPITLPRELIDRTDTVLVVATSVSENAEKKPVTVNWNLRLGVSDVDGTLMISRLESVR